MPLQHLILDKINKAGGKKAIISELKLIRKTILKKEHYIIDTSIIYINSIVSGLEMDLELDYFTDSNVTQSRIKFYKCQLKLKPNSIAILHCIDTLEFSQKYIKKLRFIA